MMGQMQGRVAHVLRAANTGVLSALAGAAVSSMPVRYRADGLELDCLLPRWSDLACLAEEALPAALVVVTGGGPEPSWLAIRGTLRPVAEPAWGGLAPDSARGPGPEELYTILRLVPDRIDLFDGTAGWGSRETLDL